MSTRKTTDLEINFLGKPSKGKSRRSFLDLLNTPGLDLTNEISTFLDGEAVKTILGKIALPCRDDGAKFTDTRRLDAIAECVGEKWRLLVDGSLCRIYARDDFDPKAPAVAVRSTT